MPTYQYPVAETMMNSLDADRSNRIAYLRALVQENIAAGRFVEASWNDLCISAGQDMTDEQLSCMRSFFFAGAQAVFAGLMKPPKASKTTHVDYLRLIEHELREFAEIQYLENSTQGHA